MRSEPTYMTCRRNGCTLPRARRSLTDGRSRIGLSLFSRMRRLGRTREARIA